jgi:murein DD-endopeptidase MepM/ murein hydrolase activator NlpD
MRKKYDERNNATERNGLLQRAGYWQIHGVIASTIVIFSTLAAVNSGRTEASWHHSAADQPPAATPAGGQADRTAAGRQQETPPPRLPPDSAWRSKTIGHGETIESILAGAGVAAAEIERIQALDRPAHYLRRLYPGDNLNLSVDDDGRLRALQYDVFPSRRLQIARTDGHFDVRMIERPLVKKPVQAHGMIKHSLFRAASNAGLDTPMILELAAIFDWDIDFSHDVQRGDTFSILYEEHYREGEKIGQTPILAAEFVNNGRTFRAVRYTASNGQPEYFTPEGDSMRKMFIRNPVRYSQVSSKFDPQRRHPVLSEVRAHTGVDYAAKTGTPIRAAGNGVVTQRGWNGGYGKTVVIEHNKNRSTLYAHMSRFSPGIRTGRKVRQGQTIGYVGQTGLTTGPHLHYEFRVDGEHVDPLTVEYEPITIPESRQADFQRKSRELIARLEKAKPTYLAMNE